MQNARITMESGVFVVDLPTGHRFFAESMVDALLVAGAVRCDSDPLRFLPCLVVEAPENFPRWHPLAQLPIN